MNIDQQVIDLATRIQRRHDFSSHVTGFLCGAVILGALLIAGIKADLRRFRGGRYLPQCGS